MAPKLLDDWNDDDPNEEDWEMISTIKGKYQNDMDNTNGRI